MGEKCKDLAIFATKPGHFSSLELTPKMFGKGIGSKGASTLSSLLQGNTTLTSLDLPKNKLGDKGSLSLSICFTGNNTIKRIDLSANGIKDSGAISLFHAFKSNTSITYLDLCKNLIGQDGIISIASWLPNSKLEYLNMAENRMGDSGCDLLLEGVNSNSTLTYLNLESNGIGDVGAGSISSVIKNHKSLTSIYLLGNKFGPKGVTSLATAVQSNDVLTRFEFDTYNNAGTLREKVEEKCRLNARNKVNGTYNRKTVKEASPSPNRSNRATISPETLGRTPVANTSSADELPSYAKHSIRKQSDPIAPTSSSTTPKSQTLRHHDRSTVDSTGSSSPKTSRRTASVTSEEDGRAEVEDRKEESEDEDDTPPPTYTPDPSVQLPQQKIPISVLASPTHFYSSPSQVQLIPNPTIPAVDEGIAWDIQRAEQKLVFARGKLDQRRSELSNANLMRNQEEFAINEIESQIARLNEEKEQRSRTRDAITGRIESLKREISQSEQDSVNSIRDLEEIRDKNNLSGYLIPTHSPRQITPSTSFSPSFSPYLNNNGYPFNYPSNPPTALNQFQSNVAPQLLQQQQQQQQTPPQPQQSVPIQQPASLPPFNPEYNPFRNTLRGQNSSPVTTSPSVSSPTNRPTKEDRPKREKKEKKGTISKGTIKGTGTINKAPVNTALYYRATSNYTAKDVGELSFVVGDQFVLEDEEDGWMNVVDQRGRFGKVPSIFTEVAYRAVATLR
eukprot:TRINITY_DN592_c0_g1_i1.p1 TRINITY_DN592_c0_g1~~TRINITY_DN592_c0_g1_i1.p1  ORF type:complete len:731 (-),score=292.28 TRINITY_DN592_c0_g1_i1:121-2313(-)